MRVALVTGGGRGVGRAIALALARTGVAVALAARTGSEIEEVARAAADEGARALPLTCDVTEPAGVIALVETVRTELGGIEILVNNAGFAESAPVTELDEALWARTLAVNLTATYLCTRAVLPDMLARRYGRVINIASTAAQRGYSYSAAYCAAKHGVLGFTRAVAVEVARRGVTVNAICPGWLDTGMTRASIARIVERTGRTPAEARAALEAMSPQRRLIQPDEVAAVALFLASDQAHGITGQAINVDGGEVMM